MMLKMKIKPLLLSEQEYTYGCVMAKPGDDFCKSILKFSSKLIPDEILYKEGDDYGREFDIHTTIKYGLTKSYSHNEIKSLLSKTKPFLIQLVKLDVFENEKFDVVKFTV